MRKRLVVVGGVVLVVGSLLVVAAVVFSTQSGTQMTSATGVLALKPQALTSENVKINWTRGSSTTVVYLVTGTVSCANPNEGTVVANGTGASGSFHATLASGKAYYVFGCSGSGFRTVIVTYSASGGITILDVVSVPTVIVGVVLLVFGLRRRPEELALRAVPSAPDRWSPAPEDDLVPRARPASVLRPRGNAVKQCPRCGRIFSASAYTTCPADETPL